MKFAVVASVLAVLGVALPAHAGTQVVAGNGLSLTDAARIKFNQDTRADDHQTKVVLVTPSGDYDQLAASFGMDPANAEGMSLAQIFVLKINHGEGNADRQLVKGDAGGMATRSAIGADHDQLAASAGLDPAQATGMSLSDVAAAKFAAGGAND